MLLGQEAVAKTLAEQRSKHLKLVLHLMTQSLTGLAERVYDISTSAAAVRERGRESQYEPTCQEYRTTWSPSVENLNKQVDCLFTAGRVLDSTLGDSGCGTIRR